MAKLPNWIDSDEEFNELCTRMVNCALLIDEDPLTTPEEREKYKIAYDHMWRVAEEYRLRDRGMSFYPEPSSPPPSADLPPAAPPPKSKKQPDKPKPDFSSWI